MIERRLAIIIAGLTVFFTSAVLWNVFAPSTRRPSRAAPVDSTSVVVARADTAVAPARGTGDGTVSQGGQSPAPLAPPVSAGTSGPSYMELLARSETRRRIRASAGYTYLNEVVAQSEDSMLHRWDNRIFSPVKVYLGPGTAANFQTGFLDAVRSAFQRWQEVGVPVRFNLDADSTSAEVRFRWRLQFEIQRTGQTDLSWDQDGHLVSGVVTLAQVLDARVREGALVEKLEGGAVRCFACGHRCLVRPGRRGICKVRFNKDGTLYVPAGYVAALQCDPTEKKPFFHALPGSDTLTFGMLGCDFPCGYCQNWITSPALRGDAAGG